MRRLDRRISIFSTIHRCDGFRFSHDAFFQLYGRERQPSCTQELPTEASASPTPRSTSTTNATLLPETGGPVDCVRPTWKTALEAFWSHTYTNPNNWNPGIRTEALKNLYRMSTAHYQMYFREHRDLWSVAGLVCSSCGAISTLSWEDRYYYSFVLYRQEQFERLLEVAKESLQPPVQWNDSAELCFLLKLVALLTMSAVRTSAKRTLSEHLLNQINHLLREAKNTSKRRETSLDSRREMVRSVELALLSLDWAYQEGLLEESSFWKPADFACFAPKWLQPVVFQQQRGVTVADLLPHPHNMTSWGLQRFVHDCLSVAELQKVYDLMEKREKTNPDFVIFNLCKEAAMALLQLQNQSPSSYHERALAFIGSSLHPDVILLCGNFKALHPTALSIFSHMSGADTYKGIKALLFHHGAEAQRCFQEKYGDALTPGRGTGDASTWKEAMALLENSLKSSASTWRANLPHTLRLLSDAGKTALFFRLLSDYNALENPRSNISVAASLAQAMRHSGRWWLATEVLDLLSRSAAPQQREQEVFLEEACLNSIYTLRSAQKWKEALSFYTALHPVMPAQCHRWLCAAVLELPGTAPWQSALQLLQEHREIPSKFSIALKCIHMGDPVPSDSHSRRYALRILEHHGLWQRVRSVLQPRAKDWTAVLRAAHRSVTPIPSSFFVGVPSEVWCVEKNRELGYVVARENGLLRPYFELLKAQGERYTDWMRLCDLILHGKQLGNKSFCSAGVVHRLTELVARPLSGVCISFPADTDGDEKESGLLASVQALGLSRKHLETKNGKVYSLIRFPSPSVVSEEVILFSSVQYIVAHKPRGVDCFAFARGIARLANWKGYCYSLPVVIPSSGHGAILLVSAQVPSRWVWVTFQLIAVVAPREPQRELHTPLLASHFYSRYASRVLSLEKSAHTERVKLLCTCPARVSEMKVALDAFRLEVNAEGWEICHRVSDEVSEKEAGVEIVSIAIQNTLEADQEHIHVNV